MKNAFCYMVLLVLVMSVMVSCEEKATYTMTEAVEPQVQLTTDTIEEQQEDTLSPLYAFSFDSIAVDTLMYKDYVFVSRPIPEAVKARMQGKSMPDDATVGYDALRYLTLYHYDYEGNIRQGEMVCNQAIAHDLLCIFKTLFAEAYPIHSIRLVDDFDADDEASMQANNTSCFNYRTMVGTKMISKHAMGMAVDVNPLQNPCIKHGRVHPETAKDYVDRTQDFPHKIDKDDFCKKVFSSHGFSWGGNWGGSKDYQHFEKR
jgi:hypothetical protein